jgi:predicted ATPase
VGDTEFTVPEENQMITELELENFKPFGTKQTAALAPITLVYGPNSGGKSSIIQSLLLLRQSFDVSQESSFRLISKGDLIDLGTFRSLIHKHELKRSLHIGVSFEAQTSRNQRPIRPYMFRVDRSLVRSVGFEFRSPSLKPSEAHRAPELTSVAYKLSGDQGMNVRLTRATQIPEEAAHRLAAPRASPLYVWQDQESAKSYARYYVSSERARQERRSQIIPTPPHDDLSLPDTDQLASLISPAHWIGRDGLPSRLAFLNEDPDRSPIRQLNRYFFSPTEVINNMTLEFREVISGLQYLGPLRSYPERLYLTGGGDVLSVGTRGQDTPQMIYRKSKDMISIIHDWFGAFEIPYKISVKQIGDAITGEIISVQLKDRRTGVQVGPSDVGFGIGQLLPVIVQGAVSKSQVICVEQPEIHLHPRLQAALADFFIDSSGSGIVSSEKARTRERNQWVIETHSEAIILRLKRRIREGKIKSTDVCVLYVHPVDKDGSAVLQLRLDDRGEFIDEWPRGFFEESYQELFGGEGI